MSFIQIQADAVHATAGTLTILAVLGVVYWLAKLRVKTHVETSLRHEYEKKLEQYRFALSKRDKVANIASFFSLWIKYRGHEREWLQGEELIEYYRELTRMSFEFALWVDDDDLLREVMRRLKNEDGSQSTVDLLLAARRSISGNDRSTIKAEEITIWPSDPSCMERQNRP